MSESFCTNFYCALCLGQRDQLAVATSMEGIKLRTNDNFYTGVDSTDLEQPLTQYLINTKGILRRSQLSRLKFFQIPANIGCDPFHDLEEGVANDLIKIVLDFLHSNGDISKKDSESRIVNFDYGLLDSAYRPKNITRMSGIQTRNVIHRFNFIFADLVSEDNRNYFEAMTLLSEIMKTVYSNRIEETHIQQLESNVMKLASLWINDFGLKAKPKLHFLLHAGHIIRKLGPLSLMETSVFERKHRFFTKVAEKNSQFMNILFSCAERHQIAWAEHWSSVESFFPLTLTKQKSITMNFNNDEITHFDSDGVIYEVQSAHLVHTYKPEVYVVKEINNILRFFVIIHVFVQNETIFLKCNAVQTSYNEFFSAYQVQKVSRKSYIIKTSTLYTTETFAATQPYRRREKYIICKRNILHKT